MILNPDDKLCHSSNGAPSQKHVPPPVAPKWERFLMCFNACLFISKTSVRSSLSAPILVSAPSPSEASTSQVLESLLSWLTTRQDFFDSASTTYVAACSTPCRVVQRKRAKLKPYAVVWRFSISSWVDVRCRWGFWVQWQVCDTMGEQNSIGGVDHFHSTVNYCSTCKKQR